MLQDNSSSNEIHSDILSSFEEIVENDIASNEPVQPQNTHNSTPSHIDIGCEPKSSRSKKSDSGCMEGDRAGSLHSPKLTLSCSLISVITSSSMLEEPNPPSYRILQSSQDIDGGTSVARHLTKVADSGAQDSNKFPSNNNNHNDSFKLTNKDPAATTAAAAATTTSSTASTAAMNDDEPNVKDHRGEEEGNVNGDSVASSCYCYSSQKADDNDGNNDNNRNNDNDDDDDADDAKPQPHQSPAAGKSFIVRSKTQAEDNKA